MQALQDVANTAYRTNLSPICPLVDMLTYKQSLHFEVFIVRFYAFGLGVCLGCG